MNYEKKYKEALEKAKNCLKDGTITNTAISYIGTIFPELKESEDERIRKTLIDFFSKGAKHGAQTNGIYDKDIIAWLEKQGEQKPADKVEPKFKVGDTMRTLQEASNGITSGLPAVVSIDSEYYHCNNELIAIKGQDNYEYPPMNRRQNPVDKVGPFNKYEGLTDFEGTLADICIGWIGEELGWKQYIKDNADVLLKIAAKKFNSVQDVPFEQKPAWSEEDKVMLDEIIDFFENGTVKLQHDLSLYASWLKSLTGRYTWKPSDKQINAIRLARYFVTDDFGANPTLSDTLVELEKQLKKLK